MIEYTPDQVLFVESFAQKRDALTLEVGMLTHEKDLLLARNTELDSINAGLQAGIAKMNNEASTLGFEQAEKIATLKASVTSLQSDLELLTSKKEIITKDLEEKNNLIISLGLLINTIKNTTVDTNNHIREIAGKLNMFTGRVEESANSIKAESERVKSFTNELGGVIDQERKDNYLKSKEIDDRENAVISREKIVELKYSQLNK